MDLILPLANLLLVVLSVLACLAAVLLAIVGWGEYEARRLQSDDIIRATYVVWPVLLSLSLALYLARNAEVRRQSAQVPAPVAASSWPSLQRIVNFAILGIALTVGIGFGVVALGLAYSIFRSLYEFINEHLDSLRRWLENLTWDWRRAAAAELDSDLLLPARVVVARSFITSARVTTSVFPNVLIWAVFLALWASRPALRGSVVLEVGLLVFGFTSCVSIWLADALGRDRVGGSE